ncbi:DUF6685 family protein [Roseomonas sp. AR75]|uniref:DUF6685 family protein n=1 Tax=Roseomonas sp. AR75 TaxID=2562311 RepID=UPI0010C07C60|nr:DUF6685 family protein [Roseomonas sp. AR75]
MNGIRSTLKRIAFPARWLEKQLAGFKVGDPRIDWDSMANACPWREYQHLALSLRPPVEVVNGDPFFRFGPFVDETETPQRRHLDIREVYGITASKSHIVPLERLSATTSIDDILAKRDVRDLIAEVLHGQSDCVARAGEPIHITEQDWDGRLYVLNSGGSHRFAAIWRWHRQYDLPLKMDCSVTSARISPATLEAVAETRYWLLATTPRRSEGRRAFLDDILHSASDRSLIPYGRRQAGGIAVRHIALPGAPGHRSIDAVAYSRKHPLAEVVNRWLEGSPATDLSAAVMRIATGRSPSRSPW